ncbi:glutaredoxin domain-containing protein [Actinokineospora sp. 24-640]
MSEHAEIKFYWRPGCPYCRALRGPLRRSGLPLREINIWDDPRAAARVRSVADGNETVPTVFVGSHAMVNPSMGQVMAAVRDHAPGLAASAEPMAPRWQPVAAALLIAALWAALAVVTPTTTYHLAPLLVVSAAPVTHRLLTGIPVPPRRTAVLAALGMVIASATTAVLAALGLLAGTDLRGGDEPVPETVILIALGAVAGWWLARRGSRRTRS